MSSVKAQKIVLPEADSLQRLLRESKPDTHRVRLQLQLGTYLVYKPGEFQADINNARAYAEHARTLSQKLAFHAGEIHSLNLLGTISREAKDFPKAIVYQKAAISLSQRQRDTKREVTSYLLLAHALRDKGDVQDARKEVQTAIEICKTNGYANEAAEAYIELGNTYANWGEELEQKIVLYGHALQNFEQTDNKRRQADILKDLGDLYGLQSNFPRALLELRKSLELYRSINYPYLQGVYDLLGFISSEMGDYQDGLKYGLMAVTTAENVKDSTLQMCTIYNRVGITYFDLKEHEKAHFYYTKSLHIAERYKDLPSIRIVSGNIANVLMNLRQPQKALLLLQHVAKNYPPESLIDRIHLISRFLNTHAHLKQYAQAQRYCDQLLIISGELGKNDTEQQFLYWNIIRFFLASNQREQARKYLAKFEQLCKESRDLKGSARAQLYWFQLDSMEANYTSAIKHYQKYKKLEDSLYDENKSKQLARMDVQFQTEQKENDLLLKEQNIQTLTKEKLLQAEKIRRDELIRRFIISGTILLLLLLAVIYNRFRLKQKSNRKLEAQQVELQAQQQELKAQQTVIREKNEHLSELLTEKDILLVQKDTLIGEKDQLLTEKEWLLKEIHHRVKNNLQVVMSLLNSQAASLEDEAALSAIQESQHRVQAMALIHQKLYQAESVARIPMPSYIDEVVSYLHDSYDLPQPIRFNLSVEPIELDVTQAVPLGLIINEAITNAFKYAFPNGRTGTVSLSLQQLTISTYKLTIKDDGVGLPKNYDPSRSRSLGMTLMHGFSRQLNGELNIISPPGMTINLVFAEEQLSKILTHAAYAR
ncbi:MAG: hypothetical protein H7122_07585 [Chitinophagaceae bacterium]|nr:hypothetical protein [Chitinophagaceae bacterium]